MVQHGQGVGGRKKTRSEPGWTICGQCAPVSILLLSYLSFVNVLISICYTIYSPHNTDQHSTTRLRSGADTESQCCTVTAAAIKGNYIDIKRHTISFAVDKNDIKRTKALLHMLAPVSLSFQLFQHFSIKWFLPKWWLHGGKHFPRIIQDLRSKGRELMLPHYYTYATHMLMSRGGWTHRPVTNQVMGRGGNLWQRW